jgi:hypothetical protein
LTINPTSAFKSATDYYINIANGTLIDEECNLAWAGISDTNTIAWRTDGPEVSPPDGPTFGSLYVDLKFDRPVIAGPGKITVLTSTGQLVMQISSNDWTVKFSEEPFQ